MRDAATQRGRAGTGDTITVGGRGLWGARERE
jgi:hypothetical protein